MASHLVILAAVSVAVFCSGVSVKGMYNFVLIVCGTHMRRPLTAMEGFLEIIRQHDGHNIYYWTG